MSQTFSKCPGHLVSVHIRFSKYPANFLHFFNIMSSWKVGFWHKRHPIFAWQCSSAVQLTDNQQTNHNLHSPYIYHGWSRYYRGQRPYMMLADLEMVKQVTVKEFNSFMDREVSNLHHFVS